MNKKTVLVTGCENNLTKCAAITFHRNGWNVIVTSRSPDKVTELNRLKDVCVAELVNTDKKSIEKAVKRGVDKFGAVNVLVNDADCSSYRLFEHSSTAASGKNDMTHLLVTIDITQAVLPYMCRQREGTIVTLSSFTEVLAPPIFSTLFSTRSAVESFAEALSIELKSLNIKAKTVFLMNHGMRFSVSQGARVGREAQTVKRYGHKWQQLPEVMCKRVRHLREPEPHLQKIVNLIFRCATEDTPIHNVMNMKGERLMREKNAHLSPPFRATPALKSVRFA